MSISIIVAIAHNNAIGKDNDLLWHISDDLKRFKKITTGHKIIMGKNTFLSLPIRPLPNRTSIVITDDPTDNYEGCIMAYSIEDAMSKCEQNEECFIIGGGSVYSQFLPLAEKLYLTKVDRNYEADTFFPEIKEDEWELIEKEDHIDAENNSLPFSFQTYIRKHSS
jgi:dihydrofolate reductase